jgi:hypothetical protein
MTKASAVVLYAKAGLNDLAEQLADELHEIIRKETFAAVDVFGISALWLVAQVRLRISPTKFQKDVELIKEFADLFPVANYVTTYLEKMAKEFASLRAASKPCSYSSPRYRHPTAHLTSFFRIAVTIVPYTHGWLSNIAVANPDKLIKSVIRQAIQLFTSQHGPILGEHGNANANQSSQQQQQSQNQNSQQQQTASISVSHYSQPIPQPPQHPIGPDGFPLPVSNSENRIVELDSSDNSDSVFSFPPSFTSQLARELTNGMGSVPVHLLTSMLPQMGPDFNLEGFLGDQLVQNLPNFPPQHAGPAMHTLQIYMDHFNALPPEMFSHHPTAQFPPNNNHHM